MYIKKRSGPRTDPCSTPQDIVVTSELVFPMEVNCLLFVANTAITTAARYICYMCKSDFSSSEFRFSVDFQVINPCTPETCYHSELCFGCHIQIE